MTSPEPADSGEVVYAVTLRIDAAIAKEYDAWLAEHAAEMLRLPGFLRAEVFASEADGTLRSDQVERVVHYRLENRAVLEAYFRDHAARMRDDGERRFGGRFAATRRILSSRGLIR